MDACSPYPPRTQSLSDRVIGSVVQRQVRPCQPTLTALHNKNNSPPVDKPNSKLQGDCEEPTATEPPLFRKSNNGAKYHEEYPASKSWSRKPKKKQNKIKVELNEGILKLKGEIRHLEARYQSFTRIPTTPTVWTVATEYFCHFNYHAGSPEMLHGVTEGFLRKVSATDVAYGGKSGVEEVLKHWKLFAICFCDVRMELEDLMSPFADILIATTTTSLTVTSDTLRYTFPHLSADGVGGTRVGKWTPLATNLLGQRLTVHGSVRFDWDSSHDSLESIQGRSDLLTPFEHLLGSLEDTSRVFDGAFVTPDGRFAATEGRY